MQKVYLLLRDNHQSGPHSIEELAQLNLQSSDLIWIEGASSGWYYPNEVSALSSILNKSDFKENIPVTPIQERYSQPPPQAPGNKKVFVSMPAGAKPKAPAPTPKKTQTEYFDQRAEMLRKKVQEFPVPTTEPVEQAIPEKAPVEDKPQIVPPVVEKETPQPVKEPEKPAIEPVEEKKVTPQFIPVAKEEPVIRKNVPYEKEQVNPSIKKSTLLTDENSSSRSKNTKDVKRTSRKSESYSAQFLVLILVGVVIAGGWWVIQSFSNKKDDTSTTPQIAKSIQTQDVTQVANNEATEVPPEIATENDFNEPIIENVSNTSEPVKPKPSKTFITKKTPVEDLTVPVQQEVIKEEPVVKKEVVVEEPKQEPVISEEPKKTGILKKIGGLFKKKNKEEEVSGDDRNSSKRTETTPTDISTLVDIKISTTDNKWMMGVQGLKLTLQNKSNVTLKKASVDVIYYNDQNGVIEKKTIYFNNVPPRKSQSVAAPDHQYADHAGYKILSAVGE